MLAEAACEQAVPTAIAPGSLPTGVVLNEVKDPLALLRQSSRRPYAPEPWGTQRPSERTIGTLWSTAPPVDPPSTPRESAPDGNTFMFELLVKAAFPLLQGVADG